MSYKIQTYGELDATTLLIQMVDDHDLEVSMKIPLLRRKLLKKRAG